MLGKQREGGGAIVEAEGVADHQAQRPFSSLKESLLMVQRSRLTVVFSFRLPRRGAELWPLRSYDLTYRGNSLDLARGSKVHSTSGWKPPKAVKEALFSSFSSSSFCFCPAMAKLAS